MSKILATGTITTGNDTVLVPGEHTGRFGLMLNGNFDSGSFVVLFGITSNRQAPLILNPETGTVSPLSFTANGFYYMECFSELIDLRIQNGLGAEDVDYVLFIGARP